VKGFLLKSGEGYEAVPGMKLNIISRQAAVEGSATLGECEVV
jgi:hypothetical protein